jgi:L-lactate dehydrogenase complex protein LldG
MRKDEPVGHASACPNLGQAEAYPTLFDTFKTRAEAVSAEVHRVATSSEAIDFIGNLLRTEQGRSVWVAGSLLDGVDRSALADRIPGLTFDVTRESAEASKVGITEMECAIAGTGTLVTDAAPVERRLASALPLIHVAVVPTGAIQPDMASALARVHPRQTGYISMITGPSRTADIERVLTIGVHGPARLVVVFVDELGRKR